MALSSARKFCWLARGMTAKMHGKTDTDIWLSIGLDLPHFFLVFNSVRLSSQRRVAMSGLICCMPSTVTKSDELVSCLSPVYRSTCRC